MDNIDMGCNQGKSKNKIDYNNIQYKDTIIFIPPINEGLVIKVYDGDTITIASKLIGDHFEPVQNSPFYRFSVRINNIDCPEIRTKNMNEKKCAIIARDLLQDKLMNKVVTLKNVRLEKYGRILADVFLDEENVSEILLNRNLAVIYGGKKKNCPDDWYEYYLLKNEPLNENNELK